ncbi:MAG: dienelactone hydrolase family protein, partial [Methanomassiliicoccales archaeon]|nr:dienelactone hydrolase family protein [Methanomassiliicoccales archaeon]
MEDVSEGGWDYRLFEGKVRVGVVLVHEFMGQDDYARQVGKDLSDQGFWVALVDLFGRKLAKDRNEALFLTQHVQREELLACMSGGLKILREKLGPGAPIGTMGFCAGGGFALQAACDLDFFFCVDYYGMIQDADETKSLKGPIILMLGSEDRRVTPWAIK